MEYRYILFEAKEAVGTITLNHPEKRNALSLAMLKELNGLLDGIKERHDVKVIIIQGGGQGLLIGPRHFRDGGKRHGRL